VEILPNETITLRACSRIHELLKASGWFLVSNLFSVSTTLLKFILAFSLFIRRKSTANNTHLQGRSKAEEAVFSCFFVAHRRRAVVRTARAENPAWSTGGVALIRGQVNFRVLLNAESFFTFGWNVS
jgi:hypothetical protein